MSRELDGLLSKLTRINNEMGGEEGRKKAGKNGGDRFHDLKTQVAERLHRLKFVSQRHSLAFVEHFSARN